MEIFSALLDLCTGNSPATGGFPSQRPVTRNFDVFFDLRLNNRLSKQSWGYWFETPSRPLWPHCNDNLESATYCLGQDRKCIRCCEAIQYAVSKLIKSIDEKQVQLSDGYNKICMDNVLVSGPARVRHLPSMHLMFIMRCLRFTPTSTRD